MSKLIPNGFIAVEGNHATLTFKRRLQHPIEAVWAAITDPEQRANWFGIATWEESHGDYKQRLVVPQRITACCLQSSRALDSNDPGLHRGD